MYKIESNKKWLNICILEKMPGSNANVSGLYSVQPKVKYLIFLCLNFLLYEMAIIAASILNNSWVKYSLKCTLNYKLRSVAFPKRSYKFSSRQKSWFLFLIHYKH